KKPKPQQSDQIYNSPDLETTNKDLVAPELEPKDSIFLTMSRPSTTSPKTTCLPSNHGHGTVVMKNWEPLVFGPALAMDNKPGLVCLLEKFSSANFSP
ncbi:hypothetical protein WICPIJ_009622, partial [Wickerhamomyces pijperi]